MPIRFPASEFFQSSGNASAVFGEQLRDGVVTFACGLWSSFPDFYTESTLPLNSFARGYMNQVCSPIQPPVPAPTSPFVGGQCPGVLYDIAGTFGNGAIFYGAEGAIRNFTATVTGPVNGIDYGFFLRVRHQDNQFTNVTDVGENAVVFVTDTFITNPSVTGVNALNGSAVITSVTRVDGMPDNCGDPDARYDSPMPTSNDLNTTINITNLDGVDNFLEIQYIQLSNQYNFPMNFKVNGFNVSLDIGGLNFYAPDGFGSPSGDNDVPPPGSDEGEDGIGNPITKTYPDNEYPVAPDSPVPREIVSLIEYLLCTDGVISTVQASLKLAVGFNPIFVLIIDILGQILTDLCETPEASLGLPEYYGLRPGVDRPAIVYLWKILTDGKWGASTYSSTVHHPTTQAIADIETLGNIQKTTGTFKTLMRLTDGSTIKATGSTQAQSQTNFDFLLNYTDTAFIPPDINAATIKEEDTRIQVKTLTLRQIEYYPQGKKDNVEPTIKRVINP